jgi:hypothetical protein
MNFRISPGINAYENNSICGTDTVLMMLDGLYDANTRHVV